MEWVRVTKENIGREHICCAIANNEDCQVAAKKEWLAQRFDEGLVFLKGAVRGKCFIEYIPAEHAWAPIEAPGYLYIDCLWVSGQLKGQGYSNKLLENCIADGKSQGKRGFVTLSAYKKRPYMADPKYLAYKGFQVCDQAAPYFRLMVLDWGNGGALPRFKTHAKTPRVEQQGFVLYYAHQCPFTAKYVPRLEQIARQKGLPFQAIRLQTTQQAQAAPAPFTSFGLFYNGMYLTHEILSENRFEKLTESLQEAQ